VRAIVWKVRFRHVDVKRGMPCSKLPSKLRRSIGAVVGEHDDFEAAPG
jgi:hypothetical protein